MNIKSIYLKPEFNPLKSNKHEDIYKSYIWDFFMTSQEANPQIFISTKPNSIIFPSFDYSGTKIFTIII